MATQDQIVPISLNDGMDTGTSIKNTQKPELIENVTMEDTDFPKKRNGFSAFPAPTNFVSGSAAFMLADNGVILVGSNRDIRFLNDDGPGPRDDDQLNVEAEISGRDIVGGEYFAPVAKSVLDTNDLVIDMDITPIAASAASTILSATVPGGETWAIDGIIKLIKGGTVYVKVNGLTVFGYAFSGYTYTETKTYRFLRSSAYSYTINDVYSTTNIVIPQINASAGDVIEVEFQSRYSILNLTLPFTTANVEIWADKSAVEAVPEPIYDFNVGMARLDGDNIFALFGSRDHFNLGEDAVTKEVNSQEKNAKPDFRRYAQFYSSGGELFQATVTTLSDGTARLNVSEVDSSDISAWVGGFSTGYDVTESSLLRENGPIFQCTGDDAGNHYLLYFSSTTDVLILAKYDNLYALDTSVTITTTENWGGGLCIYYESTTDRLIISHQKNLNLITFELRNPSTLALLDSNEVDFSEHWIDEYVVQTPYILDAVSSLDIGGGQTGHSINYLMNVHTLRSAQTEYIILNAGLNILEPNDLISSDFLGDAHILLRGCHLWHKPIVVDGVPFFTAVYYEDPEQPMAWVFRFFQQGDIENSHAITVAMLEPYIGHNPHGYNVVPMPGDLAEEDGIIYIPIYTNVTQSDNRRGVDGAEAGVLRLIEVDTNKNSVWTEVLGENLYFGSNYAKEFDGNAIYEAGFFHTPRILQATIANDTGSTNTYHYTCLYSFLDNKGQEHLSDIYTTATPISVSSDTPIGPLNPVELVFTPLRVTRKWNVKLIVYRTEGTSAGATTYRKIQEIANDTLDDGFLYFEDSFQDSEISGREIAYTGSIGQTDELGNSHPMTMKFAVNHKNRLFGIDSAEPRRTIYSKKRIEGRGLESNFTLDFYVDRDKVNQPRGNVALASLETYLIIFKANAIFAMAGDGPNNVGVGETFSEPTLVDGGVGCKEPRSVITTPQGAMFKSHKGFYLVTRGLEVIDIGEGISVKDSDVVIRAALSTIRSLVYFLTDANEILVYDYGNVQNPNRWTVFTGFTTLVDMVIRDDNVVLLTDDGIVLEETPDSFDDDGVFITQKITTGWLRVVDLNGFQRVKRLFITGEHRSQHDLQVEISYDYAETIDDTITLSPSGVGVYEFDVHIPNQKCSAIKFTISDVESGGIQGESFQLEGLSLLIGGKVGFRKLNESKRG